MSLSQQDLNVRLQKIGCCTGEQAKLAARYYLYGSECAEEQLQKLTLLNAYLDILSCYNVQSTTATNWTYQIDLSSLIEYQNTITQDDTFNLYINGELIASYVVSQDGLDICTHVGNITSVLLNSEKVISVDSSCNEIAATINVTVDCSMTNAYFIYSNNVQFAEVSVNVNQKINSGVEVIAQDTKIGSVIYLPIYVVQQGKCITGDKDNCITEAQLEIILENIAIMCKDCFKPNGFAYYNNTINLNSNIIPEALPTDNINIALK